MKISLRKYAKALCESLEKSQPGAEANQKIQNLLKILTKRKQNKLIGQLPEAFTALWLKMRNEMEITVVLAEEPTKEEVENIAKLLSSAFKKEVFVTICINPQVIGGMKLYFGDCIIDNTVAAHLEGLRKELATT